MLNLVRSAYIWLAGMIEAMLMVVNGEVFPHHQAVGMGNRRGSRRERHWPGHQLMFIGFFQSQGVHFLGLPSPSPW